MQARMTSPAVLLPEANPGIQAMMKAIYSSGVSTKTLELVHLRTSQINGCSACVDQSVRSARRAGESDDRLLHLPAWRETDDFSDEERAALALAEAATRLADRPDSVSDEIWTDAADHFDERSLAAIIMMIGATNMFNRINTTVREPAGKAWG